MSVLAGTKITGENEKNKNTTTMNCITWVLFWSLFIFLVFRPVGAPSAPVDVSVDDVTDTSVSVKWDTPENIGNSGLRGFIVEYRKDGSECVLVSVCVAPVLRASRCPSPVRIRICRIPAAASESLFLAFAPMTISCLLRFHLPSLV